MTELSVFEGRLERAFARYVEGLPVQVDAVAVTEAIAAAGERRGRIGSWDIGVGAVEWTPAARRAAWVLVLAGLLAILAIGLALVGAGPRRELTRRPQGRVPTGIEVLQPAGWDYSLATVDRTGAVWATGVGHLLRLDPATGNVRTWTIADDASFGSSSQIVAARGGGVWLIESSSLRWFDGESFRDVVTAPFTIIGAAEAPDGSLWATAFDKERGVYRWDGSTWTGIPGWGPGAEPSVIGVDRAGRPWVAGWTYPGPAPAGLWRLDEGTWATIDPDAVPAPAGVTPPLAGVVEAIAPDPDNGVWVITNRGGGGLSVRSILRFDGSSWTEYGSEVVGFEPSSVSIGPGGTVWAAGELPGSDGVRIARFDGQRWTSWGPDDGLPGFQPAGNSASVAAGNAGVFVGTGSGLYRLAGSRWERVWPVTQEGPAQADAMLAVSRDEAWAGDWSGSGVWHFVGGQWINVSAGLPAGAIVFDLARAPGGRLWAATEKGVATLDDDRWTVVDGRWSRGLAFAADGAIWVGGHGVDGGIRVMRPAAGGWTVASVTTAGLPRTAVSNLAIGRAGTVWAVDFDYGTQGLARFDGTTWTTVDPVPGAWGFGVEQLLVVAADGDVWAQLGGGAETVARFNGSTWTTYKAADGLPGNPAWLALGPDGRPWVSGSDGLVRFDGERWLPVWGDPVLPWTGRFAVAPDGTVWVTGPSMVARITTTSR